MRASISTWRTGTSSFWISSATCARRDGMSETKIWFVRASAITLPRGLRIRVAVPPPPPPPDAVLVPVSPCAIEIAFV